MTGIQILRVCNHPCNKTKSTGQPFVFNSCRPHPIPLPLPGQLLHFAPKLQLVAPSFLDTSTTLLLARPRQCYRGLVSVMAPSRSVTIGECYPRAMRVATQVNQPQIDVTVAIEMKTPPQPAPMTYASVLAAPASTTSSESNKATLTTEELEISTADTISDISSNDTGDDWGVDTTRETSPDANPNYYCPPAPEPEKRPQPSVWDHPKARFDSTTMRDPLARGISFVQMSDNGKV